MALCVYRYRESYCAHGKVQGVRCLGDKHCPVRERERPPLFDKVDWSKGHEDRFTGVWRQ